MEKDRAYFDCLHEAVSAVANRDHGAGIAACERALAMHPDGHEAQCVLAMIAADMGDLGRSIELLEPIHKQVPDCRDYADLLAVMYARAGKLADSLYYAKLALALEPLPDLADLIPPSFRNYRAALDHAAPSANYVNASIRFQQRRYTDVEEFCLRHLRLHKADAAAYRLLGRSRMELGKFEEALGDIHSAVHLDPANAEGYVRLADCLVGLGRFEEGRSCIDMAIGLAPDDPAVRSQALHAMLRLPAADERLFAEASRTAMTACFADVETIDLTDRGPGAEGGKIRVGYLSDCFANDELGNLLGSLFNAHDRQRFEIFAYQQNIVKDTTTIRLQANADRWREVFDIDDDTLAFIVASDGLDILVDLCSYDPDQRLGLLARRPAPIVASWLSWPHGAGLPAIDYVIADAATVEADASAGQARCLAAAGGLLAFDANALAIDFASFADSPASANGFVTFGAVCDLAQVTPMAARVFSRVLRAVPGSYLMLGSVESICPAVRRHVQALFSHFGVLDRIAFQTLAGEQPAKLHFYANVDIVLDGIPKNGVFGTCEALRAGVPVVSLAGGRRMARTGASILRAAGKAEWGATTEDDFVKIAASLAGDVGALAGLRMSLGQAVAASALCDIKGFVRGVEDVFQRMVQEKGLR